ncbi:MAG: hypothetical protein LQ338_004156 [Usnochroma carphineum]|nr:MAG: hypothetical protein LQ338_004156 [Usnochroma carphineum]
MGLAGTKSTDNVSQAHPSVPTTDARLPTLLDNEVLSKARAVLQPSKIPDAAMVEEALGACERLAQILAEETQPGTQNRGSQHTPASNLLSLEESQSNSEAQGRKDLSSNGSAKNAAAQLVSSTAYKVVTDPKVFITPKVLSTYVNIQSLLGRPRSFPEIFYLYATKPVPKPDSNPIQYTTQSPNKPSAHIPLQIANTALTAAIKTNDLPLCFDIIDYSVCAPAFRVSKFFRKAFVPLFGAVLAPFAIYKLASELSLYQSTMDSAMATQVLFAGMLAYVGFTATIGVVAVTTANDQMDRVTWAIGTPLRERWMREEERMLIDRVAGAWGFQQRWRRGEEEGPDWEALREWIGMRGMVLDKTELMDGME